jgi:heterodisulfide reductase subunit A-like polyferredoxin
VQARERYAATREEQAAKALQRKYGLSQSEYDEMNDKQAGQCAICLTTTRKKKLHVDHEHATGKVRALLCNRCNRVVGLFAEDAGLCDAMASYMRTHGCVPLRFGD